MGAMGAAVEAGGAVRDVEAVGEVGEGSLLEKDFFSFARLFWNHTFWRGDVCFNKTVENEGRKKKEKNGGLDVPEPPWETS
jgi:hypothetical protein